MGTDKGLVDLLLVAFAKGIAQAFVQNCFVFHQDSTNDGMSCV
jgi:hypothetical protein